MLYKFGDGKLSLKKLEERLGWDGHEVIRVAEKAQENGYVCFATSKKGKLSVALTDKGTMVSRSAWPPRIARPTRCWRASPTRNASVC